ncbi:hypothetical protein [Paenibacillus thiaminolyticus]|uniref:hypothetical protein n=1 Tax=Paenibacillus thiaminolyticus TaxID=49283 RepID=UPI002543F41E|nr:hypothetical protein [Paenibacillus thiaminolyticus]WII39975.1 hypothetical protein O0V01_13185 [Paenibacillus thiaminolyticus]
MYISSLLRVMKKEEDRQRAASFLTSEPLEELYPEATGLACPECRKEKLEIDPYMDWDKVMG